MILQADFGFRISDIGHLPDGTHEDRGGGREFLIPHS